jgi:predicted nucleic acid-binding protein
MRVFLDANILFSASFQSSALSQFLDELKIVAELVTSEHAVEEARRNVAAKRAINTPALEIFLRQVRSFAVESFEVDVQLAEKDIPILCGAIASKAEYLLTGDKKDFGQLYGRKVQGVKIVSVEMLVDALIERKILADD